ncbi:MAG: hypothetical protein PHN49_03400 [Candidatus Omnitrophica bacterium]|nr:hypothetical protein [Candidatus Omnitrophota bacterium]
MPRIFSGRVILFLILLLTFDVTVTPIFRFGDVQFFLTYLLVLYATFQWGWQTTIPMAILVGLMRDFLGTQSLGIETCSLLFASILLYLLVQKIERESLSLRMMITFIFVFCTLLVNLFLSNYLSGAMNVTWYHLAVAFGSALYTVLIMPVFFHVSAKWFHDSAVLQQYELFR